MKRHFYVSEDLDDLERIEEELETRGVHRPQIHVFSRDDTAVETHHHLHNIESVFKKDVVHGAIVCTWIGIVLAALVLIVTAYSDWPDTYTWMPFIFLAVVLLGFCAWSGGLYGIQVPHRDFKRFEAHSGMKILEGYGLTEGTCASSFNPFYGQQKIGSIGLRLPYMQMKIFIVDDEGKFVREAATDEIGSVCIKGQNLFNG